MKDVKKTSGKKRAYRIKLELDFQVMADEGNKIIDRALVITPKDSETYFDNFESAFLKQLFASEFAFFSEKSFGELRKLIILLHREVCFNQVGKRADREQFIKNSLAVVEKGMRNRLSGSRGRPKKEYSLFDLLESTEVDFFVVEILQAIQAIEDKKGKVTKTSVANELYKYNSNPVQAFTRKLNQFQLTFAQVVKCLGNKEPLYGERLDSWIRERSKFSNNKSKGI